MTAIKPFVGNTSRTGCTADLGGFGGIFELKRTDYKDPLLVSGTDGVGTKLKVCSLHLVNQEQIQNVRDFICTNLCCAMLAVH